MAGPQATPLAELEAMKARFGGPPGIARWSAADRASLAAVVRAKAAVRESDFGARFDRHRRLRQAIREIAERG